MPLVDPPIEPEALGELDKLELKHQIITFATAHNLLYRDYGPYVTLMLPNYKTPLPMRRVKEKGVKHATVHTTKNRRTRA
jgi:hypothetical protein